MPHVDLAQPLLVSKSMMTRSFAKDTLIGFGFVAAALGVLIGGQVLLLA
ncbi:MAG: hypothetical protein KJO07_07945 [Deltaproteobacteria bacterium]|nr:hypothetical protein [Deltaproteobacteria bacterium]